MTPYAFSFAYLGWIAVFALAAWAAPPRGQTPAMSAVTLAWLAWGAPWAIPALATLAALAWAGGGGRGRTLATVTALAGIGLTYRAVQAGLIPGGPPTLHLVGFAFAVLRAIHYVVERRANRLPAHGFDQFLHYMLFFPTFLAGPIMRYGEFHREGLLRRWDAGNLSLGLERILWGAVKALPVGAYLIGEKSELLIQAIAPADGPARVYLHCLQYGTHLYLSFSGYADIAIGTGAIAGFRLPENFNNPFLARNLREFWNSWHITLSHWCRDYVFVPVAAISRRPALAVIVAMLVLGLWHEISWRYAAWGLYQGTGTALCALWGRQVRPRLGVGPGIGARLYGVASWLVTVNFTILGFALTSQPDLSAGLHALATLFSWGGP